jgi:type IV pilus assembly protein PilF
MTQRVRLMAALLAVVAAQPGCVQVPVPPPPGVEPRPAPSEPADPARRAALRLELASLYFSRGQADTALEEVNRALQAKPDLAEAHSLKGLINASQNDIAAAEASFKRALQLAPNDGDTMHNFGWVLCQQRRYDEADALFTRAVAQPTYREQVRTLLAQGVCQARAGRWADAERTLSRSYEIDPSNPVTAYNLADVLLQRGELERARFYVGRINGVDALTTAQSLWLAMRIERRLGNQRAVQDSGRKLRDRFPQSSEALLFERGRFDD